MSYKISVFIKEPNKNPRHVNISNSIKNLQNTVGGYIEAVQLARDMLILCNEEAKFGDFKYNCTICGHQFFGTIIFTGKLGGEFDDVPMSFKSFKELLPNLFEKET